MELETANERQEKNGTKMINKVLKQIEGLKRSGIRSKSEEWNGEKEKDQDEMKMMLYFLSS